MCFTIVYIYGGIALIETENNEIKKKQNKKDPKGCG